MTLLFLLSCATPSGDDSAPPPAAKVVELVPLDAPRLLRRISIDLRGKVPTTAELDAVEADPELVTTYAATYLEDANFEDRLVSMLAERWHTVMDTYEVNAVDYAEFTGTDRDGFAHAVGEEPLRLIAHVVANDLPYTEVVTADYTMAHELLARVWPLEYPAGGEGWQEARYTDGRPAAGVLATNGFYWRYVTNVGNKSRGRVAAISRLLLCTDMLGRPVAFQRSQALDPEEAIRTEPGCVTCHATVDPMAATMFGFWWTIQYNPWEMQNYHPERERLGPELLQTQPAYYGTPMGGLVDLGWYLANDARFNQCVAESYSEQYWRRPSTLEDWQTLDDLTTGFEADGLLAGPLILQVMQTEQYRAGGFTEAATEATREREKVERLITPNMQRLMLEDLADLDWRQFNYVGLENDVTGYRVLAGGVDGYSVTSPQERPGLTWELVNTRFAQAAAEEVVARDLGAAAPELLTVDPTALPGDAAFDEQLRALHWRLYGVRATDAWVSSTGALWSAVSALEGVDSAWEAVLEACFRDPLFVSY